MTKTSFQLLSVFTFYLVIRLIAMVYFPLQDTTEARYAEIARIMAETGDWITPYFDYDVPFWGKPPLVFWLEALSMKLLGVNDFAPRLPSLLFTLATAGLIYKFLGTLYNQRSAIWGVTIYFSIGLVYILSGVVILDPVFTFATTLAYVAFVMVLKEQGKVWGYLFFIAVSLGLLSKGPLVLVLVAGSIGLWLLFSLKRWRVFKMYPWASGLLLTAVITLPWYIMAEMKTPGFIDYFIVGEHFMRFIDPGWSGDLYGVAHHEPHGIIWLEWLVVSLPWGLIAIGLLAANTLKARSLQNIKAYLKDEELSFYLIWALFPMLFFTLSGNVLSTYVLPGLPALAIILAIYFDRHDIFKSEKGRTFAIYSLLAIPTLILIAIIYADNNRHIIRTEKFLIQEHRQLAKADEPLYYLKKKPFSARFYTAGEMKMLTYDDFKARQEHNATTDYYLAIPENHLPRVEKIYGHPLKKLYSSKLYDLVKITNHD